jgi:hypothetical protein
LQDDHFSLRSDCVYEGVIAGLRYWFDRFPRLPIHAQNLAFVCVFDRVERHKPARNCANVFGTNNNAATILHLHWSACCQQIVRLNFHLILQECAYGALVD